MKRVLLSLIIFSIFGVAFAFLAFHKTLPSFASNHLVLGQSGKLSIFTFPIYHQFKPACQRLSPQATGGQVRGNSLADLSTDSTISLISTCGRQAAGRNGSLACLWLYIASMKYRY